MVVFASGLQRWLHDQSMWFDSARERHSAKSQKIFKQIQTYKPADLLLHSLLHSWQGPFVHGAFQPIPVIFRMLAFVYGEYHGLIRSDSALPA